MNTAVSLAAVVTAVSLGSPDMLPAHAADTSVRSAEAAKSAFAAARPGDTITLDDGDYDLGRITLATVGTEAAPLVIRARHAGKVRFVGPTGFVFRRAAYVTLSGFDFASRDVPPLSLENSHHVRITENRFRIGEPDREGTFRWVRIISPSSTDGQPPAPSHHNRIDHCLFEEKHTIGNFIGVDGNSLPYPKAQVSQYDRIDHNVFRNIGPRVPNGMEAIRVGLSGTSLSSGFTVIEENLFENCDGDPEVISVKTSDAIVRNNVFRACQGGLCLRHGNRNKVYGNRFYGDGKMGSNGVRIYGDDHTVENNYFFGLTSYALSVPSGSVDYGTDYTKGEPLPVSNPEEILKLHLRPRRITLRKNTVVNCAEGILLGQPSGLPRPQKAPQTVRIEENTVISTTPSDAKPIVVRTVPEGLTWRGNVVYVADGAEIGLPATPPVSAVKVVRSASPAVPAPPKLSRDIGPGWLR